MSRKSIATEIEALRTLPYHELVAKYTSLWGHEPKIKSRSYVFRRTAWKLQEQRFGGLSQNAKARLEELIAEIKLPLHGEKRTETRPLWRRDGIKPGATLVRQYKGEEIRVHVRPDGFEWDGVLYRSLSAVALAVTGSRWNGRLFFGLTKKGKPR
jgi:hypothetical protein